MNVPEPDEEAVKRAQRAHEPSMEEILASIRAIIADDKAKAAGSRAAANGSQVIYSAFGQKPAEAPTPTVVWSRPEEESESADEAAADEAAAAAESVAAEVGVAETGPDEAPPEPDVEIHEAPLLSVETDREVASSFRALSATLAAPDPQRVEEMTREMLRPMLKTWLDENLPSLVERLVKAEIQRVARGGR